MIVGQIYEADWLFSNTRTLTIETRLFDDVGWIMSENVILGDRQCVVIEGDQMYVVECIRGPRDNDWGPARCIREFDMSELPPIPQDGHTTA